MKAIGNSIDRKGATGPAGFTLLEILVALAVISIALVALLGLGNRSIGVHDRLQRMTQATLLAQQLMAETELGSADGRLPATGSEGEFEEPFARFRWRIDLEPTQLPSISMVTVTVLWGAEEENESVDITSFLF